MKLRQRFDVPFRRRLLGAMLLTFASAFGQTLPLHQPAETGSAAPAGEYLTIPELPVPQWHDELGSPVARLRLEAPNAAAWTVEFLWLALDNDAQMFLYGIDAAGAVSAVHGPYEKHGPLHVAGFQTGVIQGSQLVIEVRGGSKTSAWPFAIDSVERIDAAQLAGLKEKGPQVEAIYRPEKPERQASETRYAWFEEQLVPYRIIDGMAIMGGDIVLGSAAEVKSGLTEKRGMGEIRPEAHEDTSSASRLWPNGVIPYTIEYKGALFAGSLWEIYIVNAIAHWNEKFPGILVKRTTQADYVTFRLDSKAPACLANMGRNGGQQFITIKPGCGTPEIIHEIGHTAGMWHEHQRPDRDSYVTVHWANIVPDFAYAFEIPAAGTTRGLGVYDFGSIMHYALTEHSVEPRTKKTMSVKVQPPEGVVIGQRKGLSSGDVAGVRARFCNPWNWKVTPTSFLAGGNGGHYTFSVTAPPYCTWSVSDPVTWISVPTGTKTGSGSITFTVYANFGPDRVANIRIESGTSSRIVRVEQPLDPHNIN